MHILVVFEAVIKGAANAARSRLTDSTPETPVVSAYGVVNMTILRVFRVVHRR